MVELTGVIPTLITPCNNRGKFDEASLRNEVDWLIKKGVNGILARGWESEPIWYSDEIQQRMLEVAIEAVNGRVPVIAGCIGPRTSLSVEMAVEAEDLGADAVLSMGAYGMNLIMGGGGGWDWVELFRRINDAVELPVVIYQTPRVPQAAVKVPDLLKLAELRNVQYVNLNTGFGPFKATSEALGGKLKFIAGAPAPDFKTLAYANPVAVSGTVATIIPEDVQEVWNYAKNGNIDKARSTYMKKLAPFIWYLISGAPGGAPAYPIHKEMLKQMGVIKSAAPVPPKQPPCQHHKDEVTKVLKYFKKI